MKQRLFILLLAFASFFVFGQDPGTKYVGRLGGQPMTTAQRLAMTQLFEGEIVNDTTLGQSMIYHASTGWQVLPGGGGGDTLNALKSNLTATTPMLLTNVCWGDSLTYGNAPTYTPYGQWLQQITGIPFMNMGIPGASSTAILTNFQHYPQYWGLPTIIWSGYNNGSDTNTVLSDIATMVGDLTTTNWLVLGLIITTNGQGIGTATYTNNQLVLNAVLSARYTNHFVDVLGYLRNVAWLTNAADYYTYTNGSPAARLHFDNSVHLNSEGYSYVADAILQSGMFGLSNQVPTVGNTYRILNDFAAYPPMFGYGAPNLGVFSQLDIGANSNAVFYIGGDGSLTLYNANASAAFEPIPAATLGEQFWPWTSLWLPNGVNIGVTGDGSIGFSGMPSILGVGANIGEAGYSWNIAYLRDMELTNASGSNADIYTGADGSLVIAIAPALISTTKGALGETGWGWSQLVFAPSNIIVSPVADGSLFIFDAGMPVLGFNGGILGEASQPWSGGFFTNVVTNTGGSGIGIDFAGTGFHGNGSWLTSLHTFNTPSSNSIATVAAAVNTAAGWVTQAVTNGLIGPFLQQWQLHSTNDFYPTNANLQVGTVNGTNWSAHSTNDFYGTNQNLQSGTVNGTNWSAHSTNDFYGTNQNLQAGSTILSNLVSQAAQALNALSFTNYQATNLIFNATQTGGSGVIITAKTNATIDAFYDDVYYVQTNALNFSNIINVNCATNQTRRGIVHIKPNGNYTIGFNYSANCTLTGADTTNWFPVGASNGFYTLAWEIMFTNFNSNTCTYAISPPNN